MKSLKIVNKNLSAYVNILNALKLKGKESRMRTRFINLLNEKIQVLSAEHVDLIKQHSNLDENGEPIIVTDANGNQVYDVVDLTTFNKEYAELVNEEAIIPDSEEINNIAKSLMTSLDAFDLELSGADAIIYDSLCESIEKYLEG